MRTTKKKKMEQANLSTQIDEVELSHFSVMTTDSTQRDEMLFEETTLPLYSMEMNNTNNLNKQQINSRNFTSFYMFVICVFILLIIVWFITIAITDMVSCGIIISYTISSICGVVFLSCVAISWCVYYPKRME